MYEYVLEAWLETNRQRTDMADEDDFGDPRKYRRLAAAVREKIRRGLLAAGDAVSLAELAAETGWSRQTCSHALQLLEGEGLVALYPGLGYYVTAG